jgi:hypothetical protein
MLGAMGSTFWNRVLLVAGLLLPGGCLLLAWALYRAWFHPAMARKS